MGLDGIAHKDPTNFWSHKKVAWIYIKRGIIALRRLNTITHDGESISCTYVQEFSVRFSGLATVENTRISQQGLSFTVEL